MRPRLHKPGFNMIELLMALGLLVTFFAIAGTIFSSTVQLSAAGEKLSDSSATIDSALYQFRADVWNAKSIAVTDPKSVDLILSDGQTISWKISDDQILSRSGEKATAEHWPAVAKNWEFSTDGFSLTISEKKEVPTRLVSELLLWQRGRS
jgi:hypothetical protein